MEMKKLHIIIPLLCTLSLVNCESYTKKEKVAIDKLRRRFKNELYDDYMKEDFYLIRWIRDRSFDLDAAEEKLIKALKWRKEKSIDNTLKDPEAIKFNSQMKSSIAGRDELGQPMVDWKVGQWKLRRAALAGKYDQMLHVVAFNIETALKDVLELRKKGVNATQGYLLVDLLGYSLKDQGCLACLPWYVDGVGIYENYYPGFFKYIIAVNAPRIFSQAAQLIRGAMSPLTRDAFKIFSTSETLEAKQLINSVNPQYIARQYAI